MIIAKGNVHTAEGPVPVEKLETGMLVVDRGHRARKLLKVEQVQLHQTLHFEKNPELVREQCPFHPYRAAERHYPKECAEGHEWADPDALPDVPGPG